MLRLSKERFSRAIEGSNVTTEANPPVRSQTQPRRTSKVLITFLIVAGGIGVGWAGGKFLTGRWNHSTAAALPGDVPASDNPAPETQSHSESHHGKVAGTGTAEKPITAETPSPEVEQPVAGAEPKPREADPKGPPPEVPRVDKEEEEADKAEDPSKEIGRKALKEMNNKNGRASGNSNGRGWGNLNRRPWGSMTGNKPSGNKNGGEQNN